MFRLIDGAPMFYIGKINNIGYINEEEKDQLIEQLKKENSNIEIKDDKLEIDKSLKERAEKLAELKLTYSKSEFLQYLNREKEIPGLSYKELKQENEILRKSSQMSLATILQLDKKVLELEKKIDEFSK